MSNFSYTPAELLSLADEMPRLRSERAVPMTAGETELILSCFRRFGEKYSDMLSTRKLTGVLQNTDENALEDVKELMAATRSEQLSDIIYRHWQQNYNNPVVVSLCRDYSAQDKISVGKWAKSWHRWCVRSHAEDMIAKLFCTELEKDDSRSLDDVLREYQIVNGSALEKNIRFACLGYCGQRLMHSYSDSELRVAFVNMSGHHKLLMIGNFFKLHKLIDKNGKLLPHDAYTVGYVGTVREFMRYIRENDLSADDALKRYETYIRLVTCFFTARTIPVKEHADYWENRFLLNRDLKQKISYKYHIARQLLIVRLENGAFFDFFNDGVIFQLTVDEAERLDGKFSADALNKLGIPPERIIKGKEWRNIVSRRKI